MSVWVDFFEVFAKKKPKHFVWYFYSSALPVQLKMYSVTVSLFSVDKWPDGWIELHRLDHYSLERLDVGGTEVVFVVVVDVLFIIDCIKKKCFVEMHDIGCRIQTI